MYKTTHKISAIEELSHLDPLCPNMALTFLQPASVYAGLFHPSTPKKHK